jgi:hypothetical protein
MNTNSFNTFDDIAMSRPLLASADAFLSLMGKVPAKTLLDLTSGAERIEDQAYLDLCLAVENNPKMYGVPEDIPWGERATWAVLHADQLVLQHPDLAVFEQARVFCQRMRDLVLSHQQASPYGASGLGTQERLGAMLN